MSTLIRLALTYALLGLAIVILGGLSVKHDRLQDWCWSAIWVWWAGVVVVGFIAVWWVR